MLHLIRGFLPMTSEPATGWTICTGPSPVWAYAGRGREKCRKQAIKSKSRNTFNTGKKDLFLSGSIFASIYSVVTTCFTETHKSKVIRALRSGEHTSILLMRLIPDTPCLTSTGNTILRHSGFALGGLQSSLCSDRLASQGARPRCCPLFDPAGYCLELDRRRR